MMKVNDDPVRQEADVAVSHEYLRAIVESARAFNADAEDPLAAGLCYAVQVTVAGGARLAACEGRPDIHQAEMVRIIAVALGSLVGQTPWMLGDILDCLKSGMEQARGAQAAGAAGRA